MSSDIPPPKVQNLLAVTKSLLLVVFRRKGFLLHHLLSEGSGEDVKGFSLSRFPTTHQVVHIGFVVHGPGGEFLSTLRFGESKPPLGLGDDSPSSLGADSGSISSNSTAINKMSVWSIRTTLTVTATTRTEDGIVASVRSETEDTLGESVTQVRTWLTVNTFGYSLGCTDQGSSIAEGWLEGTTKG
jgi:hypothetical protein